MSNEAIIERLKWLVRNHRSGARTREMFTLLDELEKRLDVKSNDALINLGDPD